MPEEIFIISLVGIVFGTALTGFIFWNIFSLIRRKIDSGSSNNAKDLDPQFFKALGEFKRTTEKRLTNLEAIVTEEQEEELLVKDDTDTPGEIEIEEDEVRGKQDAKGGNLRNMLNE